MTYGFNLRDVAGSNGTGILMSTGKKTRQNSKELSKIITFKEKSHLNRFFPISGWKNSNHLIHKIFGLNFAIFLMD